MKSYLVKNGAWIGFILLVVIFAVMTEGNFISPRNLSNLLRQTSINGILAAGMTLIIITGGIDLSIGSIVAVAGVVAGISQVHWGWADVGALGAIGSLVLAIGAGGLAGFFTGALVALLGIAPFVITLGMMVIARGLSMIFSKGGSISPMGDSFYTIAGTYLPLTLTILLGVLFLGSYLFKNKNKISDTVLPLLTFGLFSYGFLSYKGLPILALILVGVLVLLSVLLNQTTFGRGVYAVGSNESAAVWAGVPAKKIKWITYTIMGLLAGLGGALLTARLNGADPNAGQLFELDAIAAAVIGGTSLKGGSGTILGSFIGALTIATLNNGMDLLGVPSFYQMVFKGLIIIAAVSLDKNQRA